MQDFYILILYPATLPNSLMNFSGFLLVPLGFSIFIFCGVCCNFFFISNFIDLGLLLFFLDEFN